MGGAACALQELRLAIAPSTRAPRGLLDRVRVDGVGGSRRIADTSAMYRAMHWRCNVDIGGALATLT
eukprot:2636979-Pyramimonas_sp.AAC.1